MKKAISILIIFAVSVFLSLLFLKSDFLRQAVQKKITEVLSSLPYEVAAEVEGLSLFPPELLISSIKMHKNGSPILVLNSCRVDGIVSLAVGMGPRVCADCESGELNSGNLLSANML